MEAIKNSLEWDLNYEWMENLLVLEQECSLELFRINKNRMRSGFMAAEWKSIKAQAH